MSHSLDIKEIKNEIKKSEDLRIDVDDDFNKELLLSIIKEMQHLIRAANEKNRTLRMSIDIEKDKIRMHMDTLNPYH